ncbi:hypothetical protein POPTR_006G240100v4 [Populus trichocarpa]|uniref:Uncharacterized protein n=1 Tax=Populus trichocarpa TaxID=3694 RepID=A0ACC0SW50_POPTR|nr:hypothetical protein POPTR_006G240100v4 [Populus trichocarpa]
MDGVALGLNKILLQVGLLLFLYSSLIGKYARQAGFQQLQCNVFEGTKGEVTLTAAGGVRQLPGPAGSEIHENAALVKLEARAKDLGTPILAPACIDTCSGVLKLQMWEWRQDGTRGKVILKVTSDMAAVEVGGGPWFTNWKGKTSAPELLRRALRVPIDLDAVYNSVPFFKPPGLQSVGSCFRSTKGISFSLLEIEKEIWQSVGGAVCMNLRISLAKCYGYHCYLRSKYISVALNIISKC